MPLILSDTFSEAVPVNSLAVASEDSRVTVRRRVQFAGNENVLFHTLHVNIPDFHIRNGSAGISLTKKEFDLLLFCLTNRKRVMTKEALINHLWNEQTDTSNYFSLLHVHIRNLRKKLLEKGCPDYFSSVYGVGYRFRMPREVIASRPSALLR